MTTEDAQKLVSKLAGDIKKLKKSDSTPDTTDFKAGYKEGIKDAATYLIELRESIIESHKVLVNLGIRS